MNAFGPTFADELRAANVMQYVRGWSADGTFQCEDGATLEQRQLVESVIASHDPNATPQVPLLPLSPRQLRLMMLQLGLVEADILAAINQLPEEDGQRAAALIEWNWATEYRRDHALVALLADALDFAPNELDDLWLYASTI